MHIVIEDGSNIFCTHCTVIKALDLTVIIAMYPTN